MVHRDPRRKECPPRAAPQAQSAGVQTVASGPSPWSTELYAAADRPSTVRGGRTPFGGPVDPLVTVRRVSVRRGVVGSDVIFSGAASISPKAWTSPAGASVSISRTCSSVGQSSRIASISSRTVGSIRRRSRQRRPAGTGARPSRTGPSTAPRRPRASSSPVR